MPMLLESGDPPPFSVYNLTGQAPLLLLCDHASKAVPLPWAISVFCRTTSPGISVGI